jgi:hypothetical protein
VFVVGGIYVVFRRGTESQRARPPRCEALPPKLEGLRVRRGGFLKRPGAASFSFLGNHVIPQTIHDPVDPQEPTKALVVWL